MTSEYVDPVAPVILGVTGILFFAIAGRFAARKLGQPSALGEVIMGILIGMLGHFFGLELVVLLREGPAIFDIFNTVVAGGSLEAAAEQAVGQPAASQLLAVLQGPNGGILMRVAHVVDIFSRYGVIFLLFLVGLESSIEEMQTVGFESGRVAIIGVVAPFALGFLAVRLAAPGLSLNTAMFIAATLGATSIGITASVLTDMGRHASHEGRLILGAAVIDDILGLLMLAVVSGIIVSGAVELGNVLYTVALAILFLSGAVVLGPYVIRLTVRVLGQLDIVEAKMFTSFMFVMILSWLANLVGLATIIGAFAAGVILHEGFFEGLRSRGHQVTIKDLIMPLEVILVPIFFILIGIQVKLETFLDPKVAMLGGFLLLAAIVGKVLSGWGAKSGANRWLIGFGMMPRGEVGLIFASIGRSLGVISDALFSAVVLMVIATTLLAPPLMKLATRWDTRDG